MSLFTPVFLSLFTPLLTPLFIPGDLGIRAPRLHIPLPRPQEWTIAKRVARCLKCAERPPYKHKSTEPPPYYGRRFLNNFRRKFRPVGRSPGGRGAWPGLATSAAAARPAGATPSRRWTLRVALAAAITWLAPWLRASLVARAVPLAASGSGRQSPYGKLDD